MTKTIVTGSSGFVGSLLCKVLNVGHQDRYDVLETEPKDITLPSVQDEIASKSHTIVHLAAISGIKSCNEDPERAYSINSDATIDLANKAKLSGCKRFIFASSSAVYGEAQSFKMDENHPTDPRSVYGRTKLEAENVLKLADKNFHVVIFRKSNLYGYGLTWKGITVIDKFIEAVINKEPIKIVGTGAQKRDFLHVTDAVKVYAKVAVASRVRSGIYNLGGQEPMSVRAIAEMANDYGEQILGRRSPIEFLSQDNDPLFHDFRYDSSKARMEFQYSPFLTIDDFLKERFQMELRK